MLAIMPRKPRARTESGASVHPLLQWRERYRISQSTVALATGLKQVTISRIENGERTPLGESLERLMALTGLPTDAFIRPARFIADHPDFLEKARRPT